MSGSDVLWSWAGLDAITCDPTCKTRLWAESAIRAESETCYTVMPLPHQAHDAQLTQGLGLSQVTRSLGLSQVTLSLGHSHVTRRLGMLKPS